MLPPKKHKALAEKRQKEGTMHCPWDQDLLPLWEAFPGRAPICATHSHASFQHPPPQLGSLDLVMEGQLQTQSCAPKIISRLPVDRTFRYTWGVWAHLAGLTSSEGVKWDFCTGRVLFHFSEMPWPQGGREKLADQ